MDEKNSGKDVQSLLMDYAEEKVEEETFESKMDSLFNQLDAQFEKVKRYANIDIPLDQVEIDQYKFKYNYKLPDFNNNILNNNNKDENLIELNNNINNNENKENKDNNDNVSEENIEIKSENKRVQINEIKEDEEMKKKMYDEMAYQRMEEERKIKEMELEKKREKNIEEEKRIKEEAKRIKEEQRKKEEELIKKEKDLLKKEKELERKRKEEEKKIKEEQRKREEDEELNEKLRLLKEEEDKLRKEEEEKEKEEKRESDRIKELRILREKKEKEEKEKKLLEDQKKKQLEQLKKEKEIEEQEKLKEQIKQKMNNNSSNNLEESNNENNEIKIAEIDSDDGSIQELEEFQSSITKTQIKESNNKTLLKSNIKSINAEANNSKFRSANKTNNKSLNKFNNFSRNKKSSPTKKSQVKDISIDKNIKKPKEEKKPENDLYQEKKEKDREESEFAKNFKNSKIYSKISQEIIDKILEYIYAIDDFEEKKSEEEEINIYPSINEFAPEEKNLKELIPDFEKKILENDKLSGDDRMRKYYNEEEAFEENQENLKINELLIEIMSISNETHMDLLQKKFEKENLKNLSTKEFEDFDSLEEIEIKLFEKEDFYPEYNPIISNLENLQTFIYKFRDSAEEKPEIMVNAYKYFNYWRLCLNDGNSFYRVNMFALIEHCILQKDSNFLFYILSEICSDDFIEYYKEKKIEYEKPFKILSVIRLFIEKNLEEDAHKLLLKAYNLKSGCFDILLITYLKKVLINYGEEINKLLEEKKKSEEKADFIEEAKIDIAQIESMYLDPPKINLFYLISGLFNINIKLFLLGGKYLEPINSLKEINSVETSPTFVFGYFFSGYNVLYSPDYDSNSETFKNIVENDNPQLCRLTYELKEEKKCDICFKETKHMVFLKKKFIVCIPCLLDNFKEKIKKRSEYFFEDECLGQEYYSRPIHLQGEFYIDDYEYSELIDDDNIINNLYANNKGAKCISCGTMKNDDIKMITLDCKCCYCSECLKKVILNLTKNNGYLLPCEVEMFGRQFKCDCGRLYNYKDLEKLYYVTDEQKEAAKERLSYYKDNHCLICLKSLIKEENIKKIKIRKEKEDDKDHFICNKCFVKHFKNVTNDSDDDDEENTKDGINEDNKDDNEIKVIKDEHKIKCAICRRWHHYAGSSESCGCNIA